MYKKIKKKTAWMTLEVFCCLASYSYLLQHWSGFMCIESLVSQLKYRRSQTALRLWISSSDAACHDPTVIKIRCEVNHSLQCTDLTVRIHTPLYVFTSPDLLGIIYLSATEIHCSLHADWPPHPSSQIYSKALYLWQQNYITHKALRTLP